MSDPLSPPRRVVTGHDAHGRSVIEADGPPPRVHTVPERPGYAVSNLWRTGQAPDDVARGDDIAAHAGVLPPEGGTVLRIIDFPPEPEDPGERARMLAATFRNIYPDTPHDASTGAHQGMHRTLTVDYAIVLRGEIVAVMDAGETVLRTGDVLIQRGTNHAWANRSGEVCRMCFVLIAGRQGA